MHTGEVRMLVGQSKPRAPKLNKYIIQFVQLTPISIIVFRWHGVHVSRSGAPKTE
jgi:hypothetical protein